MASLKDIRDGLSKKVTIKGTEFEVTGVAACDICDLIVDHPDLETLMQTKVKDFHPVMLVRAAPKVVGMIIAMAIGKKGDQEEIEIANKLGFADQVKFMSAIFELTFSDGVGPFVEELNGLTAMLKMKPTTASATASRGPSAGLVVIGDTKRPGAQRRAS